MTTIQANPNPALQAQLNQALLQGATGIQTNSPNGDPNSPPVYLTPEALMLYISSRLNDLDGQVQTDMVKQQNLDWEQQGIGNIMTEVQQLESTITNKDSSGNGTTTDCTQLEKDLESLIASIQQRDPTCPVLGQLETLHDTVMATGTGPLDANDNPTKDPSQIAHGFYNGSTATGAGAMPNGGSAPPNVNNDQDGKFGNDELSNWGTSLQGMNSTLNSSAELGMIDIQSKMSQRSTAIQLATNILQSYDDGLSKIAGNIGGRG
jgi:hypothetical protein